MHFTQFIKQIFPNSKIVDTALIFPRREDGWAVDMPQVDTCNFHQDDFKLILNLQDMLTGGEMFPEELTEIHNYYAPWGLEVLKKIIVIVWPLNIKQVWPKNSFHIIEFSSHQYETWQAYKEQEDVLRDAFSEDKKDFEYNFLCMNRIQKPHRSIAVSKVDNKWGNISLQSAGRELSYPSLRFNEYDDLYDNLVNLLSVKKNFNTSLFSIVTESQFTEQFGIITEKTFNAIVAGHPILMIGHIGALENIKTYGFQTFENMFNEDYDIHENDVRLDCALQENRQFWQQRMSNNDMQDCYEYMKPVIDWNRDWFFDQLGDHLLSDLRLQLLDAWK
jgi:hypothetical protein